MFQLDIFEKEYIKPLIAKKIGRPNKKHQN
jgi:hypothetical protein